MHWYLQLQTLVTTRPTVMITVMSVHGSAPRNAGTHMFVTADGQVGTIGGGGLEFHEVAYARSLLGDTDLARWTRRSRRITLGVDAGQCCGGVVDVLHEVFSAHEVSSIGTGAVAFVRPVVSGAAPLIRTRQPGAAVDFKVTGSELDRVLETALVPKATPLTVYGAGHVGRAVMRLMADLPFAVTWIDITRERFVDPVAAFNVQPLVLADPVAWTQESAANGLHLVVTHSHDLDYRICASVLQRGDFAFLGLIGSQTKRARFVQRFRRDGIAASTIARLVCPIGDPRIIGKAPAVIAVAVTAQLLQLTAH